MVEKKEEGRKNLEKEEGDEEGEEGDDHVEIGGCEGKNRRGQGEQGG